MIERKDQLVNDTWDLSALTQDEKSWDNDVEKLKSRMGELEEYKGKLGSSSDNFHNGLYRYFQFMEEAERVLHWAFLCYSVDSTNPEVAKRSGSAHIIGAEINEKSSWMAPELMAIDDATIEEYLKEERNKDYRVYIQKARRMKEHVLSDKEERILSLYSANSSGYQQAFQDANNIDFDFGYIGDEKLTHSTYAKFIRSKDEKIREQAYKQLFSTFENHQHILGRIFEGSIKNDIFIAKARGYNSALECALFPDNVAKAVYTSLIENVHKAFPALHRYYALRARLLGKEKIKHYDVYTSIVPEVNSKHTYQEAVDVIKEAVKPLGEEYSRILVKGLTEDRWVDRYENKGKRSGAFSSGGFVGNPYILTNFEEEVLDSVFTLIHEGGHSMHSYYSSKNNPYPCYDYTIFEAEVASTFNENLLNNYLLNHSSSKEEEAYLISKILDDMVATFFRQTMFAEYEMILHESAENGTPLTIDFMRKTYRGLLEAYFGESVEFEDCSDMEGLRIPHFYNAFYVYKYATGIAASISLSQRVLNGGEKEKNDYLTFLKSGGSRYPIEALKVAGVDMSKPDAVIEAGKYFENLLNKMEELTK